MKDTLRDECDDSEDCLENCCINQVIKGFFSKKIICFFLRFWPLCILWCLCCWPSLCLSMWWWLCSWSTWRRHTSKSSLRISSLCSASTWSLYNSKKSFWTWLAEIWTEKAWKWNRIWPRKLRHILTRKYTFFNWSNFLLGKLQNIRDLEWGLNCSTFHHLSNTL